MSGSYELQLMKLEKMSNVPTLLPELNTGSYVEES